MAKHVILESYTFTPSTRTIVVNGKNIRREQLLLITNVTRNTVIYNFSDPNLGATSYSNSVTALINSPLETTTIVLNYNTSSMSSTDKLAILTEETYQEIQPAETFLDPVGKMRVSEPQSLIDTDFEYGTQPTKWETVILCNNRPSAYYGIQQATTGQAAGTILGAMNVSNITGSFQGNNSVTIQITDASFPVVISQDQPIYVQGTTDSANADGWFIIDRVNANVSGTTSYITYKTLGIPRWDLFDTQKTYVFAGQYFANVGIPVNNVIVNSNVITVSTTNAHNLRPGNSIWLTGVGGAGTFPQEIRGSWVIATTPSANTFTCNAYGFTGAGPITNSNFAFASNILYARPFGLMQHRSFDGGVQFSTLTNSHGYQLIRQTRRYFRYQSGKGVQFSTGSILKPALNVDNLSASGTSVTVYTKFQHGMSVGTNVIISGVNEPGYNGAYPILSIANAFVFTYGPIGTNYASANVATGFPITVNPNGWYGAKNRLGLFDEQNGFFFEFDGQTLYVVKRSSTQQVSGVISANLGSSIVTGTGTKFSSQLIPGDKVVIRGMSYQIQSILSDTQLVITPEYRGVNIINSQLSKTIDSKYPQSSWNIDKCDGTGASGFNVDLTKMQMFYIDYAWYGAGAIRFGMKNTKGEVIYVHRIVNNNINTEAYMRSGNMPARYETNTLPPYTILAASLSSAATTGATITVADASLFPSSGTIAISTPGLPASVATPIEYISYSAKSANTLTIQTRALAGGVASANTFTYSATSPIGVELYGPPAATAISHWGSAVVMDGKYDDDKSLVFNIGQNNAFINPLSNQRNAIISLRISPSVDNGFTGLLGAREIINRMQLVLRQMDTMTTAPYRIEIILNGIPTSGSWLPVGGSSLAQYILHANATTISGGENMFSFFTQASGQTQQDMTIARDIGNSIMGGGGTSFANVTYGRYPDGPDMITICATPLAPISNINARISWTEAQA